jgi:hypothetical protein
MDYIARFDQFGEYTFSEALEAEGDEEQMPKIYDPVKSKYEEEIYSLVKLESNSEITEISQDEMDNFITMMEESIGRNVFLDYLGSIFNIESRLNHSKNDLKLPCTTSFNNL